MPGDKPAGQRAHTSPALLPFIGDLRDQRVLDAGCGEGHNTRILARAGARMTGVDISERMIELAREAERHEPLGIRHACTSYAELGTFEAGEFDGRAGCWPSASPTRASSPRARPGSATSTAPR